MVKAISLLSGGLDSILATRLIIDQGVDVEAVNFKTVFCNCTARDKSCMASISAADSLGIKLKVFEVTRDYLEIVKAPKHGYGRNLNPCLDCRIFMFKKAKEYMKEVCASFIVTGEVLGERPMSQRVDAMRIIEKESELKGLIVRPLCAKLMEPTIPEKEGLIDREKFFDIHGRSRKPQIKLALDLGINDYPCPAGGCLLTDTGFANRMRDIMKNKPDFTVNDVKMLKLGRHFRLSPNAKLIVGRDEKENDALSKMADPNDITFCPIELNGPLGIGIGAFDKSLIDTAASIVAKYCDRKPNDTQVKLAVKANSTASEQIIISPPADETLLTSLRI